MIAQSDLYARIIMHSDGNTHIVLPNLKTYECTAQTLIDLLGNPNQFISGSLSTQRETTSLINPYQQDIWSVPGVTLAYFTTEKKLVFEFVDLFLFASQNLNTKSSNKVINILENYNINALTDEKQKYLSLYPLIQSATQNTRFTQSINLSDETKENIFKEILSSFTFEQSNLSAVIEQAQENISKPIKKNRDIVIPENYISSDALAEKLNLVPATILLWARTGKIKKGIKDNCNRWWFDPNEEIDTSRSKTRKSKIDPDTGKTRNILQGKSYEDIQLYIKERQLVTDAVRKYVRTFNEIKYYEKNNYREVCWDDEVALIIDIVPEYYSPKHGMTNAELILAGKAPVVPNKDNVSYHLHHIGQTDSSPLAILPEDDHKEKFDVFHQTKASSNDLHDSNFAFKRAAFWSKYLEVYNTYGSYKKIPYNNPKKRKK